MRATDKFPEAKKAAVQRSRSVLSGMFAEQADFPFKVKFLVAPIDFLVAINGLFQAAKRKARGYGRFQTMRTVIYLVARNLDFSAINPHAKA